jgi:hypothetical protein
MFSSFLPVRAMNERRGFLLSAKIWGKAMNKLCLLAASAAILSVSAPSHAVLLNFTISGDYSASFQLDSNPTPDDFSSGTSFTLWDVPGFPDAAFGIADLEFWNASSMGGLTITDFWGGGLTLFDATGTQLYSGPESAPTFIAGVYSLTELGGGGTYRLTIAAPGIPEPAVWAMMIAGFGVAGAAMRRRPVAQIRVAFGH